MEGGIDRSPGDASQATVLLHHDEKNHYEKLVLVLVCAFVRAFVHYLIGFFFNSLYHNMSLLQD